MDIKQLKYLIALDQTRHFGQAAAACHITQPTLSMRIRNLEEELNLTLIQRGQRFEGFTPEGERILAWARAVLAAHDGPGGRGGHLSRADGRPAAGRYGAAGEPQSDAVD
ncbi:LysR family transcriptional regulator [Klebsiella pneumoniae]|uniref:LysR family transcriptional regulator n=1 Tax=Klebsiella pneumoniae TaxID=573 RepID=A0A447RGF3_KLEPN|nr:LysR family transcriptional regulator [Klebsiella pneumoniae]